jgi:hypothetical protein
MVTRSLADITNAANRTYQEKSAHLNKELLETSKTVENYLNNQESSALEAQLHEQLHSSRLPLADSFIDNNGDNTSKRQLNNSSLVNQSGGGMGDFDDMEHMGGPGSVFNPNFDDMLEPQVNLEVTPSKDDKKQRNAEETDEDEDSDNEEGKSTKSGGKNNSPKQKRSYKKSLNNTSNKENNNTTLKDDLDELDDTVTSADPSKNLTKRAKTMISLLNKSLNKYDNVGFTELTKQNSKKTVVQKFYSLLVLTKYEIIEVSQDETYGDIIVSKGEKFDSFTQTQV